MCVFSYPNVMFVFPTAMLCMLASPMLCVTEIMMMVMMVLKMIKKMTAFIIVRCSMHVIQCSDIFFRVAKCHGYGGYIRVKELEGWGKKSGRIYTFAKLGIVLGKFVQVI